jgi:hypothetical protein
MKAKNILLSALVAGISIGAIAQAGEKAPAAAKADEKNKCKGEKHECKGENASEKNKCTTDAGEKHGCGGKDGCGKK